MDKEAQLNAVFVKAIEMAEALEKINHQFALLKKNHYGSKSEGLTPEKVRQLISASVKLLDTDDEPGKARQGVLFQFEFEHLSEDAYKALCAEKIEAEQKANTADAPAETDDEPLENQKGNKSPKKHKRQKGSKNTISISILKNCCLPKEYRQIDKEGDVALCDTCGNPLTVIDKETVSAEIYPCFFQSCYQTEQCVQM